MSTMAAFTNKRRLYDTARHGDSNPGSTPYADAVRGITARLRVYLASYTALVAVKHSGDPHEPSASHRASWERLGLDRRHGPSRGCRTVDLAFLGYQAARAARELVDVVGGSDGVMTLPMDVRRMLADVDERAMTGANGFTVIAPAEGC